MTEEYYEAGGYDEEEGEVDDEEEKDDLNDISDIKSTPSKALRPSAFKDRVFILYNGKVYFMDALDLFCKQMK